MTHLAALLNVLTRVQDLAQRHQDTANLSVQVPRGAQTPVVAALAISAQTFSRTSAQNSPIKLSGQLQVVVTANNHDAEALISGLQAFIPAEQIGYFPAWETLPHERISPRADTVATRLRMLRQLAHPEEFPELKLLVMPVRALLQPIVAGLGELRPVKIRVGEEHDLAKLQEDLVAAAYTHVDMVENRGEFAVRGGILDVFPPTESHPIRVDFFGDEVEEIRSFTVADQRSIAAVSELYAPPCREILLTDDVRSRAAKALGKFPGAVEMLDKIASGVAVDGMESLAPILVEKMIPVIDMLPKNARILALEPERIRAQAESLLDTTAEFLAAAWSNAAAGGEIPLDVEQASFQTLSQTTELAEIRGISWWNLTDFASDNSENLGLQEVKNYSGDIEAANLEIRELLRQSWQVVVLASGTGLAKRLAEQFSEADLPVKDDVQEYEPRAGVIQVLQANLGTGFISSEDKLLVLSAADLLYRVRRGGNKSQMVMPKRRKKTVDPLNLKPGDYVVHDRHGVGQFVKLVKRTVGGAEGTQREYVVVEYAASKRGGARDQLWIPTDQLHLLSKYAGGEAPSLNKMGGTDWAKTKAKARAAVKTIAKELIRLYAQRRATRGHAFAPDTPWQRELEDAFEFVETPDQLSTIEDVKRDMESLEPMDRLISGDVGYGKTEIAVRAAFKAVQDGKQVAVLVPTTLLGQQHLETFKERYAGFPVKVEGLSRFQSAKESERIKAGLKDGSIDIVIGTHKLVTGEVRFKDLGLVIIDEEQRFGVEHKESLKQLYPTVDVLAMSATPIPRTLEMAVTGIRQMSTLATPPEERHPILTYVGAQETKQISAAIKREILRGGQVFYIHNRTESINRVATEIGELVPEARVAVAHGKMSEHQLEDVIQQFWQKDIDVLVCTTIVETGLDISNANTLIVEDAQKLGLSQLHQLRGRVGRGRERAYAYFLYPGEKAMTETAIERLRTIAAHTELGAGIQVALKDLEIRGAGNLLGGEQSGHIAGVGFDLYLRMISEAVAKLTGQAQGEDEAPEQKLELPVDAFVPQSWVAAERLRLEIYTKISGTKNTQERAEVRAELIDRYGEIPVEVERLFAITQLRDLAAGHGIFEISVLGRNLRLAPVELPDFRAARLKRLYPKAMFRPAVRAIMIPVPEAGSVAMPTAVRGGGAGTGIGSSAGIGTRVGGASVTVGSNLGRGPSGFGTEAIAMNEELLVFVEKLIRDIFEDGQ